jgi:hypothetical protein
VTLLPASTPTYDDALRVLIDELANRLAVAVAERLRAPEPGMTSQHERPLRRKHNGVVRRRLARGEPGACIVGRLHYLSREALAEELGRISRENVANTGPSTACGTESIGSRLERELRAVRDANQDTADACPARFVMRTRQSRAQKKKGLALERRPRIGEEKFCG